MVKTVLHPTNYLLIRTVTPFFANKDCSAGGTPHHSSVLGSGGMQFLASPWVTLFRRVSDLPVEQRNRDRSLGGEIGLQQGV